MKAPHDLETAVTQRDFRSTGGKRLLVIDDDPNVFKLFSHLLRGSQIVLESRSSVAGGLACFLETGPDYVFIDVGLPLASGTSLAAMMSSVNTFSARLALMSANPSALDGLPRDCVAQRCPFFPKPLSRKQLYDFIRFSDFSKCV